MLDVLFAPQLNCASQRPWLQVFVMHVIKSDCCSFARGSHYHSSRQSWPSHWIGLVEVDWENCMETPIFRRIECNLYMVSMGFHGFPQGLWRYLVGDFPQKVPRYGPEALPKGVAGRFQPAAGSCGSRWSPGKCCTGAMATSWGDEIHLHDCQLSHIYVYDHVYIWCMHIYDYILYIIVYIYIHKSIYTRWYISLYVGIYSVHVHI